MSPACIASEVRAGPAAETVSPATTPPARRPAGVGTAAHPDVWTRELEAQVGSLGRDRERDAVRDRERLARAAAEPGQRP